MRFTIPQFIEHEPKIVGPLTIQQFAYIAIPGAICFVLYYIASPLIFYMACVLLEGTGLSLAFIKVDNIPLPTLIANFLKYTISPKLYLWGKESTTKEEAFEDYVTVKKEKVAEDELPLKINSESRLKNIKTKIETKAKS